MATLQQQIKQLLQAPEPDVAVQYFKELTSRLKAADRVEVRLDAGGARGKGVFALRNFKEGDTIFEERCVVGCQDTENRSEAQVCAQCYKFTGTIESQIGRHLLGMVARHDDLLQEQTRRKETAAAKLTEPKPDTTESEGDEESDLNDGELEELEELRKSVVKINQLGTQQLEALLSGALQLPGSNKIKLPAVVHCRRACGEEYCSVACEEAAWEQFHCVMCPMGAPAAESKGSGEAPASTSVSATKHCHPDDEAGTSGTGSQGGTLEEVYGIRVDRKALRQFYAHATDTNDIFVLVAKVIVSSLRKAHSLLAAAAIEGGADSGGCTVGDTAWEALLEAWRPFSMGWKKLWWESVATPEDVEDEGAFRKQLKDLATESLDLLTAAIQDERFPALFSLEVFGSLVGMFELNNLGIEVLSPVVDYFDMLDDLPKVRKMAAKRVVQPFKSALGDDYDTPCEGTAFYCLQSCANHSCLPNVETETDPLTGSTHITALKAIKKGEEVVLSYIDEEAPLEERQEELRDYGFECKCAKCIRQMEKGSKKR